MGACDFSVLKIGQFKDVRDALKNAVSDAQYEYGHGGYSGTIAEKGRNELELAPIPANCRNPLKYFHENAHTLIDTCDKWGAVKYFEITNKAMVKRLKEKNGWKGRKNVRVFFFYGLASS